MPPSPIVYDGLWRCLCPCFRPYKALSNLPRAQSGLAIRNGRPNPTPCKSSRIAQLRSYSIAADLRPSFSPIPGTSVSSSGSAKPSLVHLPTRELYERLRNDAAAGRHEEVMKIVNILIRDRRERPNITLYSAILHSFVSPEDGTAGKVRKVLEEMREEGIEPDAATCHHVLEALAVHPDYLLRSEILEYMKERWFTLSDRGHNFIIAGLLRDRLFEQALENIESMIQQRVFIAPWVYDMAMYFLLDYREVEEAYQLALLRRNSGDKSMSHTLWMQLLDSASKFHHVEGVNLVWNSQIITSHLKPPTGTCLNVLNMAARNGDVKLATDVFRVLAERQTVFDQHHYEMLLEAYLNAKDLDAALSVLVIMQEARIKVDGGSANPLYNYLVQDPLRPMEAFDILQSLEHSGRNVPTAAINACMQASVQLGRLEEAIEIYKALHTISRTGPNTATFNILFQGCHKARRKELAMFLAAEMIQLNITPDALTYDRLVLVCCYANDVEDAFLYYEEMRVQGHVPRKGTFEILIGKGVEAEDPRTPAILKDMKSLGIPPKKNLEAIILSRFTDVPAAGKDESQSPDALSEAVP